MIASSPVHYTNGLFLDTNVRGTTMIPHGYPFAKAFDRANQAAWNAFK